MLITMNGESIDFRCAELNRSECPEAALLLIGLEKEG